METATLGLDVGDGFRHREGLKWSNETDAGFPRFHGFRFLFSRAFELSHELGRI